MAVHVRVHCVQSFDAQTSLLLAIGENYIAKPSIGHHAYTVHMSGPTRVHAQVSLVMQHDRLQEHLSSAHTAPLLLGLASLGTLLVTIAGQSRGVCSPRFCLLLQKQPPVTQRMLAFGS